MDIVLEAGHAFGSGAHRSTQLVIHLLQELAEQTTFSNILDIGCGSGVLSIAAAKLLGAPVLATDIAPQAVTQTLKNAKLNATHHLISALRSDGPHALEIKQQSPYDLILCNVLIDIMIPWLLTLKELLVEEGVVCFSGILALQEDGFVSHCREAGLTLLESVSQDGWCAVLAQNRL